MGLSITRTTCRLLCAALTTMLTASMTIVAQAAPEEGVEPRRQTLRIGLGGDISVTAPSVWALRISGRDDVAALASDIDLANAATLPRDALRDLTPPLAAEVDQVRIAAATQRDVAAREALARTGPPNFDLAMAQALGASHPVTRDYLVGDPERVRREKRCLAEAIYFEARGESVPGQAAVAEVVLNRVESVYWPSTICGVVNQGAERKTGCQFSYTCDGVPDRVAPGVAWARARRIAEYMMRGGPRRITGRATHYHADYVDPPWNRTMERTAVVGQHIFYRRLLRFTIR